MALNREQVVQTAEKFVSRGKVEAAIREYKKVLAENPSDANTLNRVGDLYARIQRIDEAVDFFTQIAEKYSEEGFFVKAIAIYKKIIKLDPTRLEVYEKLAELYAKQGLVNEARTQYQVLGDYYQKHENSTSAIAIYQKMAELEPDNPSYHVKLAELYQQERLTEKALNEHRIIAELMIAHGHPQEAAQVYERALDIDAGNIGFITDAVLKLREAGHAAAAARLLSVAVERNPQAERIARLVGADEPGALAEARRQERDSPPPELLEPLPPEPVSARPSARPIPSPFPTYPPDLEELDVALDEVEAAVAAAAGREVDPGAADRLGATASPGASADTEFDLDLDEVFVLDMEDDAEPASLVKPPPDLLARGRRPAWALGADEAVVDPPQSGVPDSLPPSAFEEPPAVSPGASPLEAHGELDLEFDLDLDASPLEIEALAAPGFGEPEPAEEAERPFLDLDADSAATDIAAIAEEFDLAPFDLDGSYDLELPAAPAGPEPAAPARPEQSAELFTAPPEPPAAPTPPAALAESPPPAPGAIDAELLERTAADLHPRAPEREEDLVTEAEVLAKYGLEEKAMERLREALRLNPRHLEAFALMIQLHLDKGRHPRVLAVANQMSSAAANATHREPWLKVRKRLVAAGYRLDGDRVVAPPQVRSATAEDGVNALLRGRGLLGGKAGEKAPPAASPRPAAARRPTDLEARLDGLLAAPPPPPSFVPTVVPPTSAAPVALTPPAPAVPSVSPPAPPAAMAPAPVLAPPPAVVPPPPPPEPVTPAPGAGIASSLPPAPMHFDPLEIGAMVDGEDVDFDLDAGPAIPPPPPRSSASIPVGPAIPSGAPPPLPPRASVSGAALDDTGMSWLDEVEAGRKKSGKGRGLSDEDDFFDLAAELENELSREDGFQGSDLLMPAEQSLEQIVEGFKKGVAENLSPTDYDTHFNLGIAYREMGLLDEAIGEFQLAAKDPSLLVACCSMLGLCFLDKGLPELAIKWYRRGLESPRASEEDSLGLMYDMGNVYDSMGDRDTAYKTFVDIYGINTNYRDVVARIEDLNPNRQSS